MYTETPNLDNYIHSTNKEWAFKYHFIFHYMHTKKYRWSTVVKNGEIISLNV